MSRYRVPRDKESGLPKKYTTGDASTDKARARHFKIGKEKDSKDRSAYEPAPGDRKAKTRESQYTEKYKEMFGEDMITESANAALKKKAEKSGISVGTLRKVYKRGVAAWRTGHRPGTTPQQWGMARVNSFITKGKTYHTADKDLREDYEHEMARNELKTAMRAVERLMRHFQSNDTDDIEAWVQSKITKATDYLDTLADYMDSSDRTVKEAKVLSRQAKKLAIPDTTMPTADRSISGGGMGIVENDESGNVVNFRRKKDDLHPKSNDWKKLHDAVQLRVGQLSSIPRKYKETMEKAANTNEETILKEARKALGKMATKPKSAKIKYISKLTKPPAEKKPKQTRKRSKKWDYNKEVKALKDKFENDMKTYRDPVMRAVIKKQHRTELKALKSIHRVHKGKHPDPIYKRLLSSFGIHLEEYGAGEQGTDALVQKYINDTPGQQCSKTVKTIKKVVSEAARRYDPVAGYRRGRPFRGGRRMKARKSGKSRQIDASRPKFVAGKVKRKMNRQAQKAMRRTMTVAARGT